MKQSVLRRLISYLRLCPGAVILALGSLIIASGAEIMLPIVMRSALDNYILPQSGTEEAGNTEPAEQTDPVEGLKIRCAQYFFLLLAVLLFSFIQIYAAARAGQKVMAGIRVELLEHIMQQSLSYLSRTPVGSLVSRVANDVETVNELFTNVAMSFLKDFSIMTGVVIAIFALNTRLALITLTSLIPTLLLIVIFRNRMRESFRQVRSRVSKLNAYLSEHIGGMETLQLFNTQKQSREQFSERSQFLLKAELKQMRIMAVFRPLIDMISSSAIALVIWFSSGMYNSGFVTLGVLIAFIDLIRKFFQPVGDIAEKFNILQSAMAGGERIFAMLDNTERIQDTGSREISRGDIQFENVHFSYVPGEPVLNGISLTIPQGSTVAIVGATGSGKTTISNLLTRLWDPCEGQISCNGVNIQDVPLSRLRLMIQPVQQDVFLFAGSIADNIAMGEALSREEIERAARLSRAESFIRRLPDGYSTQVTEGASNLSAGERQLIAFARILAHDPRVIILDEATASIDTATEQLIQEGMAEILSERTALLIAHRLSTVRRADSIIVLSHGRVAEQGTHEELMRLNGVYANLYKLQFADA